MSALVEIKDVCKVYNPGENEVRALDHVSLTIDEQEFVAIIGHSGSGKSTLMNMLGCLDVPTSGEYWLHGQDVSALTDDELSDIRNREIGFIFQGFNLIPNLTAVENVELPLIYRGVSRSVRQELSREALKKVGLEHRMDHKPSEMSGGGGGAVGAAELHHQLRQTLVLGLSQQVPQGRGIGDVGDACHLLGSAAVADGDGDLAVIAGGVVQRVLQVLHGVRAQGRVMLHLAAPRVCRS